MKRIITMMVIGLLMVCCHYALAAKLEHKRVSNAQAVELAKIILKDSMLDKNEINNAIANPFKYADLKEVSLNSNSNPAYIVTGITGAFYGNNNALIWIYEKSPNGYNELLSEGGDTIKILSHKTNGYKDILITCYDHRDKKTNKWIYKFNGNKYKEAK